MFEEIRLLEIFQLLALLYIAGVLADIRADLRQEQKRRRGEI